MKKVKYGKIVLVVFITVLIWVCADLALDERLPVSTATITVARYTNPNLWVSFNGESSVHVGKIILKGPAARIAEVRRKLNDGSLVLEFFLDPQQEAMSSPGTFPLNVLSFLRQSDQIKQLGLTVESCELDRLSVDVVELVKMPLAVKCVDEEQLPVKTAAIEPPQVDMFVPKDWSGDAKVQLSRREVRQARSSPVEKTPYIELGAGRIREASTTVKITTPKEEDRLSDYTITTATLGFTMSANLQGKYRVVVTNLNEVIRAITIRATPEAKQAYDKMRYQVILEIDDSDKDAGSAEIRRELIYNFPPDYVRRDEIMLNQQPAVARFNLVPLTVAETPLTGEPLKSGN